MLNKHCKKVHFFLCLLLFSCYEVLPTITSGCIKLPKQPISTSYLIIMTKYLLVQWFCIMVSHETLHQFDCFDIFISFIEQEQNHIRIMECTYKYLLKTIKVIIFNLLVMVRKNFFGLPLHCFGVPMQCVTQNHEIMKF